MLSSHHAFAADPSEHRNVVADFLYQADTQWETEAQEAVVRDAFNDMLNDPVEELRGKRYPDWNLRPSQWSIIELLQSYFLPESPQDDFPDEATFYRDVKKPDAQRAIHVWLRFKGS